MGKKKQSAASWRKRGAPLEQAALDVRRRANQERRTGGAAVSGMSDAQLFAVDARAGGTAPVGVGHRRVPRPEKRLRVDEIIATNPHVPVVMKPPVASTKAKALSNGTLALRDKLPLPRRARAGEEVAEAVVVELDVRERDLPIRVCRSLDAVPDALHGARHDARGGGSARHRVRLPRPRLPVRENACVRATERSVHERDGVRKHLRLRALNAVHRVEAERLRRDGARAGGIERTTAFLSSKQLVFMLESLSHSCIQRRAAAQHGLQHLLHVLPHLETGGSLSLNEHA